VSAPHIVTFYSYKGGTGRSMALANVAWILASSGKRMLLIDWDLEAPGLHRYFHPFLLDRELTLSDGLIDFVMRYAEAAITERGKGEDWYKPYANISRYAIPLEYEFGDAGSIDLVPAGRQGTDYATRVNAFNWQHFYEKLSGGLFLEAAKRSMEGYDYVLIDSRTGVSDTSGICTVQMPNTLIICFTLNTQSIEGAAAVAESADAQRRNAQGKRTLRIFPIPTRVEPSERVKLNTGLAAARKKFDPLLWHLEGSIDQYWEQAAVRYEPFYAYEEVLAVFGDSRESASQQSMLTSMEWLAGWASGSKKPVQLPPLAPTEREALLAQYLRKEIKESPYVIGRYAGHTAPIRAAAISPDGKWLATGDENGVRRIWSLGQDLAPGVVAFAGSRSPAIRAIAFTSDSRYVFAGLLDGSIQMWQLTASGALEEVHEPLWEGWKSEDAVNSLAVTSDGVLVRAAGSILALRRIAWSAGLPFGAHNQPIRAVAVTSDNRFAISASFDRLLIAWNLEQTAPVMTFSGHTAEVSSVAVSADSRFVLSGSFDTTVRLWEFQSGLLLRTLEGHTGRVEAVALSPDGRFAASGSADRTVNIWEVASGRCLVTFTGHLGAVNAVIFHPDGRRLISTSDDYNAILWNLDTVTEVPRTVPRVLPPTEARTEQADGQPLVYLAYSARDWDRYVQQFRDDLRTELLHRGLLLWDDTQMTWGAELSKEVAKALATAKVAVCLVSPGYVQDENCGKEFSAIRTRSSEGRGIYPILWSRPLELPGALAELPAGGFSGNIDAYRQEGLRYLMRLSSRYREDYQGLVSRFAGDIQRLVREAPLAAMTKLAPIAEFKNAFLETQTAESQGTRNVVCFIAAESHFGKPLLDVVIEVGRELNLVTPVWDKSSGLEPQHMVRGSAGKGIIMVIIADRKTRKVSDYLPEEAYTDPSLIAHCALIVINAEGSGMLLTKAPAGIGYYAANVRSEAALRDALRTGIIKIQHALIAGASVDQGDDDAGETPSLPAIS
jgi:WD40 repeat protein/MinD-like ATPase involved in chromosome partitioning or flagellar assembly